MFKPKTEKIENIAESNQGTVERLDELFGKSARVYIDYANVRPWSTKLGWHIEIRRLKQFLNSFDTIEDKGISFYNGYLAGDERSEKEKTEAEDCGYILRTKPVKIMKFSIDASSIPSDSTALLNPFVRRALLRKYEVSTVEYLNQRFADMNRKGEYYIEDRKCNFDVEIGTDMLLDAERNNAEVFVLWSGDSDFADSLMRLLKMGKKVVLCATAGRISSELNALRKEGLKIFDIFHAKDFICWKTEIGKKTK